MAEPDAHVVALWAGQPAPQGHHVLEGAVTATGAVITARRWLGRTTMYACQLSVVGARVDALRAALRDAAPRCARPDETFDVCVRPAALDARGERLLMVLDVDSTLIQDEVIELIADHAGTREQVAAVTEEAMRGELDFASSLVARVATLDGVRVDALDEVRSRVRTTAGARTMITVLHRFGHRVGVVSGGFAEVIDPLARELGLDHMHANRLEAREGTLTGRVVGEIVDRAMKETTLRRYAEADGIPLSRTIAVGDGANDLDMLAASGLGIAFCAKPAVRAQADATLSVRRLDALLYFLGVSDDDIGEALAGSGITRAE